MITFLKTRLASALKNNGWFSVACGGYLLLLFFTSGCATQGIEPYRVHQIPNYPLWDFKTKIGKNDFKVGYSPSDLYMLRKGIGITDLFTFMIWFNGDKNGVVSAEIFIFEDNNERFVYGEYQEMLIGSELFKVLLKEKGSLRMEGGSVSSMSFKQRMSYTITIPNDKIFRKAAKDGKDIYAVLKGKYESGYRSESRKPADHAIIISADTANKIVSEIDSAINKLKLN